MPEQELITFTAQDRSDERRLKKEIKEHGKQQSKKLVEIHERRLFLIHHESFEKYCLEEFGYGKTWSYQVLKAERTKKRLTNGVAPKSVASLAVLDEVEDDDTLFDVIDEVNERAAIEDREPTANDFKAAIQKTKPKVKRKPKIGRVNPVQAAKQFNDGNIGPVMRSLSQFAIANSMKSSKEYREAKDHLQSVMKLVRKIAKGKE